MSIGTRSWFGLTSRSRSFEAPLDLLDHFGQRIDGAAPYEPAGKAAAWVGRDLIYDP